MSETTPAPTPTETRRWKPLTSPENLAAIEAALEPEVDETPTEPHHDVRFVDFVFSVSSQPPDDAWDEVADLIHHWAERHGLDVFGIASMRPTTTGANVPAAAAPAEREALPERLPERFRFSREVYGDVADDATRVLLALTDGGHADQPSDYLRWVSITAAQALAARPAPVVNAADVERAAAVLLADYQQQYDGGRIEEFLDLARAVARALGLTVADEGRA